MADPLETAPDPLAALGFERPALEPVLTIAHHPRTALIGRRRSVTGPLSLGRGGGELGAGVLDDELLSRQHAALVVQADEVVIRDLGSRNGTFVNGEAIESRALVRGDVVGLGATLLVFGRAPVGLAPASDRLLIGVSAALAQLLKDVHAVAEQALTVLIRGETGVGKELVARRIHELSRRRGEFVTLNCGGVADGVVGSELFGHRRGAFSGADADRAGLVETAARGTMLLDEIGDASPALQTALLRLLQEREYRPVGGDRTLESDVRFIAATHVRLDEAVASGRFRQDLLARLRRFVIDVPPLREHREDIVPIALKVARDRLGGEPVLERGLARALLLAPWPDNVRGLAAIVENALLDAEGGMVTLTPRVMARLEEARKLHEAAPAATEAEAEAALAFRKQRPDAAHLRRRFVALAGNMKGLAEELGVARNTLYRWFREDGLDPKGMR